MRNIVIHVMMIASHTDGDDDVFSAYADHSVRMFVLVVRLSDD